MRHQTARQNVFTEDVLMSMRLKQQQDEDAIEEASIWGLLLLLTICGTLTVGFWMWVLS